MREEKILKYLLIYLEDGRPELSNNSAEQSIKPFVIGRKNGCFAILPQEPIPLQLYIQS